ncbi:hypothetical protein [Pseudomonas chlororaphis]|uniref:hypothetical protein n=1 Tax=Pseudomonas chlororaphis TaxID=587753 RepID=UPI001B308B28|nr:hypothetical protein [Pseudomonas chlororaphis]MBP5054353.1 hypothetical protein [Pseudomonas chlororaphis]MBP5140291.1 hypothetical protein [Pseudomonas chlororaphis]QTT99530.1 hypothetical protein HUT26_09675 [Pseudomonas chlororaphis]
MKLFKFLLAVLTYLFATLVWFYKAVPAIFDNPSDLELIAGVFGIAVWVIATACIGAWFAMRQFEKRPVDAARVNQLAREGGNVNQTTQNPGSLITENSVIAGPMHIDDRVRMAANARRYEWLRDGALGTGSANVPMVRIGAGDPVGGKDLDTAVDAAELDWPIHGEWPWTPDLEVSAGPVGTGRSGENVQEQQP